MSARPYDLTEADETALLDYAAQLDVWLGVDVYVDVEPRVLFARQSVHDALAAAVKNSWRRNGEGTHVLPNMEDVVKPKTVDEVVALVCDEFESKNDDRHIMRYLELRSKTDGLLCLATGTQIADFKPPEVSSLSLAKYVQAFAGGVAASNQALLSPGMYNHNAHAANTIFALLYLTLKDDEPNITPWHIAAYCAAQGEEAGIEPFKTTGRAAHLFMHLMADGTLPSLRGLAHTPERLARAAYTITLMSKQVMAGEMRRIDKGLRIRQPINTIALRKLKEELFDISEFFGPATPPSRRQAPSTGPKQG